MLRTGTAKVVALAVPNVKQPYFGQIFVAAELAARAFEFAVILIDTATDPNWAERLVSMLRSRMVAGCIVYANDNASAATLRPVRRQVLFIEAETSSSSGIDLNLADAMSAVAKHLADLGHVRVGYFSAEYPKATYRKRFACLNDEAKRVGLRLSPEWWGSAAFELEPATQGALALIKNAPFTAVFCDDDLLAAGVYRATRILGLKIPRDLSVVGFNDLELARTLSPELTSVAIPAETIGRIAVERLLQQLQQDRLSRKPYIAELALHVRESTAPPGHEQLPVRRR
jgi:LacI family transcriptional regulator/LacI family repressor for deo operon, udp, cdd, tsx, nupC, and nupG